MLSLASVSGIAGSTVPVNLSLNETSGAPAALEWTVSYSPAEISSISASAGPALAAAGKALSCSAGSATLTCVAAGLNAAAIGNGVVAVLNATLASTGSGSASMPISNVFGAYPDASFLSVTGAAGAITVNSEGGTTTSQGGTTTQSPPPPQGGGAPTPTIAGVQCSPTTLAASSSSQCTVTLSGPAAAGTTMTLWSNDPDLTVPPAVTFPAGGMSATFSATAGSGQPYQVSTITLSMAGSGTVQVGITVLPPSGGSSAKLLLNAGGGAYMDPAGETWGGDYDFIGGTAYSTGAAVLGTPTPALYQSSRYGNFSYQIPVANGSYTVVLKFADPYFTEPGSRVFNVSINGARVLTNFDIVANAGGGLRALDTSFPVNVMNGQISIQFTAGPADYPTVSAIAILPSGTSLPPSIAPYPVQ